MSENQPPQTPQPNQAWWLQQGGPPTAQHTAPIGSTPPDQGPGRKRRVSVPIVVTVVVAGLIGGGVGVGGSYLLADDSNVPVLTAVVAWTVEEADDSLPSVSRAVTW